MYAFIFKLYAVIKTLSYDVAVVFNDVAIPWIEVFTFFRRRLCVHVAADWLLGPKLVNNNSYTCFLCLYSRNYWFINALYGLGKPNIIIGHY